MKCQNRRLDLMFLGLSNNVFERIVAVFLSIALLLFQTGCKVQHSYHLPQPLSEDERARLGTIGIISADFVPETKLFKYVRGRVKGAGKGMVSEPVSGPIFITTGSGSSGPGYPGTPGSGSVAAVLLGILAVGVVFGEVYRAVTALPTETVKDAESNLKKAFIELKMQQSLKKRFFQTAREQSVFNFVLIEEGGPKTTDEILNYKDFKEKGINTVIELSVLSIGFEGAGGKDPILALLLDARTRVLSVSDGAVLYESKFEYRSAKRKFTEWISNNGELFSEELERGYETLSEKMVEELFLRYNFSKAKKAGKTAAHLVRKMAKA